MGHGFLALVGAWLCVCTPAFAGPFGGGTPIDDALEKREAEKTEEEKAREARLERFRQSQAQIAARVVVLQWQDSTVDYTDELVRRNVRARIARPSAKFYPDVDLYQDGRKEPDDTLRPLDQRAVVPDDAIGRVMAAVNRVESIPWNGLSEADWGILAYELKDLSETGIWFLDRPELREPQFRLYAEIGYAAENSNNPTPPFFEEVAGVGVNYYYYLAAAMASREPSLMSKLLNGERYASVDAIKTMIDQGRFLPMTLNFEIAGKFDAAAFTNEYTVWFNGMEGQVTNLQALYDVPPGRMDVSLRRDDGYSMSMRVEEVKLDDEGIYGVRDQARKRVGIDFINQLMRDPEQCMPNIDGDILNYLAIYQKLHPGSEVFVAVPRGGSTHDILLWKWLPDTATLVRINDNTGGFPVRFVALVGTGLTFSGLALQDPFDDPTLNPNATVAPGQEALSLVEQALRPKPSSLPVSFELRGHWSRVMVGVQLDYAANIRDGVWREVPQTGQADHVILQNTDGTFYEPHPPGGTTISRDFQQSANTLDGNTAAFSTPSVRERTWQRGAFLTLGGVLGPDAAYGFGPRIAARTGWYNAPHAVDLTGHVGWAIKPPLKAKDRADTRVFPVIDTDLFGGVALPFRDSILLLSNQWRRDASDPSSLAPMEDAEHPNQGLWAPLAKGGEDAGACLVDVRECKTRRIGSPIPAFGFTLKAGLTF
ncbi:MAG: hypothetical protein R3F61_11210 [Myxococcota bacterium]